MKRKSSCAVATGCDRLLADPGRLKGRKYGLLAHGASISSQCRPIHLALQEAAGPAAALFGPEHGYYGIEQDMVPSASSQDTWTGAPLTSLYGEDAASLKPRPEAFAGLDLLIVDLQDVGARYYTYAATAVWAAEAALAQGCEVWVLDRPNPLGGEAVEGNIPQPRMQSFVGAFRMPVRHGLTLGEIVRFEAQRRGWGKGWEVWPMTGWRRSMLWEDTRLPWIPPSPNMPTAATAFAYPGSCLIEATDLSEGRGTTRPFLLFGEPGFHPPKVAEQIAKPGLAGVRFVPTYFKPQFHKHAGRVCGGVEIVITDRAAFRPYLMGVELLTTARLGWEEAYPWRLDPYEFVDDRPAVDLLTGSDVLRDALDNWDSGLIADWVDSWKADEAEWRRERRDILLYAEGE
jgi:uncharacterized protein YbbC (DUF1343 family)